MKNLILALAVLALAALAPAASACGGYAGAAFIAPAYSYSYVTPAALVQPVVAQTFVQPVPALAPVVAGYGYGGAALVSGYSGYGYRTRAFVTPEVAFIRSGVFRRRVAVVVPGPRSAVVVRGAGVRVRVRR